MPWIMKQCAQCHQPFEVYTWPNDLRPRRYCSRSCASKSLRRTHCKRGHLLTPENSHPLTRDGVVVGRQCKQCHVILNRMRAAASQGYQSEETMLTYLEIKEGWV